MFITHTNIHTCGHSSYVDTDYCRPYHKALEIATYMDKADSEKGENPTEIDENVLLTLLAEWRRRCAHESEDRGKPRNYKCDGCLTELLERTGLAEVWEGEESKRAN
jgi:hypothetical protein